MGSKQSTSGKKFNDDQLEICLIPDKHFNANKMGSKQSISGKLVLSGKKFNDQFGQYKPFCKILKNDAKKISYKVEKVKFDKNGVDFERSHFTAYNVVHTYIEHGAFIGIIEIPDNAVVVITDIADSCGLEFQTNKFVTISVDPIPVSIYENAIKYDETLINSIPNSVLIAYPNLCLNAVKQNGFALINVPSEVMISHPEICLEAVNQAPAALQFVPESIISQYPSLYGDAIRSAGQIIKHIPLSIRLSNPKI